MNTLRNYEAKVFNKINPLVNFSVTRYVLAVGIFVAVAVFGIVSIRGLGVDLLPEHRHPGRGRSDLLPRATPSVMDLQVTQVIENVVSTVSGITDINSFSSQGISRVILTFDPQHGQVRGREPGCHGGVRRGAEPAHQRHGADHPDLRSQLGTRHPVRDCRPGHGSG